MQAPVYVGRAVEASGGGGEVRAVVVPWRGLRVLVLAEGEPGAAQEVVRQVEGRLGLMSDPWEERQWRLLLTEVDQALRWSDRGGEAAVAVVAVGRGRAVGAAVGDVEAWWVPLRGEAVLLTRGVVRRPRVGSGRARPVAFGPLEVEGEVVVGNGGLLQGASVVDWSAAVRGREVEEAAEAVLDAARSPSGELRGDAGVLVARVVGGVVASGASVAVEEVWFRGAEELEVCAPVGAERVERLLGRAGVVSGQRVVELEARKAWVGRRLVARGAQVWAVEGGRRFAEVARRGGGVEVVQAEPWVWARAQAPGCVAGAVCLLGALAPGGVRGALEGMGRLVVPGGFVVLGVRLGRCEALWGALGWRPELGVWGHGEVVEAGVRLGLVPMWAETAEVAEWDSFVWRQCAAWERWAWAGGVEGRERARVLREAWLGEGRGAVGYGVYVFAVGGEKPGWR